MELLQNMDIAMTTPVGQNQMHIGLHVNLINYKHRCMRRVIDTAYGTVSFQSIIIIQQQKLACLAHLYIVRLDNIGLLGNRNHNLPGARCTKNLKIYFILRFYKLVQQASVWYSIEGLGKIQNGHINRYMLVTFKQEILSRTVTSMVAFHMNVIS